jgi:hypothetical protein
VACGLVGGGTPVSTSNSVVSGRGRLSAGSGVAPTGPTDTIKMRLDAMADQVDSDVTFTFTPPSGSWFLTVGSRTRDNGSIYDNYQYSDRGMYAGISAFFGSNAEFRRWAEGSWFDVVTNTPAVALPTFTAGTAYKFRFRVRGYGLFLRVWLASSAEPAAWNMTAVDFQAWTGRGKLTIALAADFGNVPISMDIDDVTVTGLDQDPAFDTDGSRHSWTMWARTSTYALSASLPIVSAQVVLKHMDVSRAVITTPYSAEAFAALLPPGGVVLFRDHKQIFSGMVGPLELEWDDSSGRVVIKAECVDDVQHLADRLCSRTRCGLPTIRRSTTTGCLAPARPRWRRWRPRRCCN